MKIAVLGLWHLGPVTAACAAEAGFEVVGVDFDQKIVTDLAEGTPPLFEPGLDDLIEAGIDGGKLAFSHDASALSDADVVWVSYDTPVDDNDVADIGFVHDCFFKAVPFLKTGAVVLISSQVPVGTTRQWSEEVHSLNGNPVSFAYSPENLRLGKALSVFRTPERIVVGTDSPECRRMLSPLMEHFCDNVIWVSIESAEMTKHAVNSFLATSVTFINEIASVCEKVGADAGEVERALRSEPRIGPNAYIRPGGAFAGGTLARDVEFLAELSRRHDLTIPMIGSILESNREHRMWPFRQLEEHLGGIAGQTVCVLGLAYKPGTSATRRSTAIELCEALATHGAHVQAFDPEVSSLPHDIPNVEICESAKEALRGACALVLATEWEEFGALSAGEVADALSAALVVDANYFLGDAFADDARLKYVTVGKIQ